MQPLQVASDIIPIGEFKMSLSRWLKNVNTSGHPLVITQNGKPAGVLISPSEYDELVRTKLFVESVQRGLTDAETGRVYSTQELQQELKQSREPR
ncbi:type II toxin-antitoxin system Phd/YefM family antitoxin [candidate division KSB1 bacterium]|nr:type II toxin-antitoxin system Phd/YefM family antitoxin [candidate division KSB1 bacterium]